MLVQLWNRSHFNWHLLKEAPPLGRCAITDGGYIHSVNIYNSANYNKGYGTAMMQELIEVARQRWFLKAIRLNVEKTNKYAVHLYEKCGFVKSADWDRCHSVGEMFMTLKGTLSSDTINSILNFAGTRSIELYSGKSAQAEYETLGGTNWNPNHKFFVVLSWSDDCGIYNSGEDLATTIRGCLQSFMSDAFDEHEEQDFFTETARKVAKAKNLTRENLETAIRDLVVCRRCSEAVEGEHECRALIDDEFAIDPI